VDLLTIYMVVCLGLALTIFRGSLFDINADLP